MTTRMTIERVDPTAGPETAEVVAGRIVDLFTRALPTAQRDDRFDDWSPPDDLVGAIATVDGVPAAYLGGAVGRGRLQLDAIVAVGSDAPIGDPDPTGDGASASAARHAEDGAALIVALFETLAADIDASGADTVELWGRPERPWHPVAAAALGMRERRALHQLRCPLPVDEEPISSRPFVPGVDEQALVTVNNRAFSAHPDQGGMTVDDVLAAEAEPWFDPDGIRLHDDPDGNGLAGFCWTKTHPPLGPGEPALGEIYAIGVDPDHHGKGLGRPMTAAGLRHLSEKGLRTGMLYVEADNEPALRTYDRIGFVHHRTDRAWHREI